GDEARRRLARGGGRPREDTANLSRPVREGAPRTEGRPLLPDREQDGRRHALRPGRPDPRRRGVSVVTATRALAALACLVGATVASAQAIRPVDYLPLGQGAQWQFQRVAGSGPADLHLEVTDVTVADSGTRYFVQVPGSAGNLGLRLEYATDGSLR